ncbi:MAG: hypothetical protein KJ558_06065 [Gammaproteobacteria bacterium]|nr:hypothetical protein [Gammaproteobacteria bacterium]MBU1654383.1 hypothetical protein [Gammaproteobacteria bacterium]MBU1960224.1 hypothetical protein [Gammaproteobacteria bacterium]
MNISTAITAITFAGVISLGAYAQTVAAETAKKPEVTPQAMPMTGGPQGDMPMMGNPQGNMPMMGGPQGNMPMMGNPPGNMPMTGYQPGYAGMPCNRGGNMPGMMWQQGGMPMMQQMPQHMQTMETRLANIEALLKELVELQKKK